MTMDVTRRDSLLLGAGALAAAAAAPLHAAPAATPKPSLNAVAKHSGRRFGSAVGMGRPHHVEGAFADPRYRSIVAGECGLIVPENELKWSWVQPAPGVFDFSGGDRL